MLFISTSTFPYFSELLARANVQIYELNEEENETHNSNSKNKIGNYFQILPYDRKFDINKIEKPEIITYVEVLLPINGLGRMNWTAGPTLINSRSL